ncbi:hypothetical protein AVEN_6041-1 [Araneus ventricosus]|uniref:Uncharacterized protein n=1 Tax=Araneus ventricosus TaxID=182803 RepID=A0A4Y2TZG7_ARAVE|nr:hypothetical protein AVEN_6041-1 [Araneus ventricosus]
MPDRVELPNIAWYPSSLGNLLLRMLQLTNCNIPSAVWITRIFTPTPRSAVFSYFSSYQSRLLWTIFGGGSSGGFGGSSGGGFGVSGGVFGGSSGGGLGGSALGGGNPRIGV